MAEGALDDDVTVGAVDVGVDVVGAVGAVVVGEVVGMTSVAWARPPPVACESTVAVRVIPVKWAIHRYKGITVSMSACTASTGNLQSIRVIHSEQGGDAESMRANSQSKRLIVQYESEFTAGASEVVNAI
jgi:hypothetical protein